MIELVTAVLLIGLLLFVAQPFFRPPEARGPDLSVRTRLDELLNEKEEVYLALKDIDLEYRMGKLSLQDYEILKRESEGRAVDVLREIEATQAALGRSSGGAALKR